MMTKIEPFKFLFLFLAAGVTGIALADSNGPGSSGGGDLCEARIQIIANDIQQWIISGAPKELTLPGNLTPEAYSQAMLAQFKGTQIKCVGAGDEGYPVRIGTIPKVCKFAQLPGVSQITCDLLKFQAISESDQYVLIHHEYAGLANLEAPNGEESTYLISNQLTEYLEDQVVKKLALKPQHARPEDHLIVLTQNDPRVSLKFSNLGPMYQQSNLIWSGSSYLEMNLQDARQLCEDLGGGARLPTMFEFRSLAKAMSIPFGYDLTTMPDVISRYLWSSTLHPLNPGYAYFFSGLTGEIGFGDIQTLFRSVKCVVPYKPLPSYTLDLSVVVNGAKPILAPRVVHDGESYSFSSDDFLITVTLNRGNRDTVILVAEIEQNLPSSPPKPIFNSTLVTRLGPEPSRMSARNGEDTLTLTMTASEL